jgi:cell division protein FtsZ
MGTGEAVGEDRALMAAQNAIANPLLDEISLKGAKAVLVNVTGGLDMTLLEVDEAANAISAEVDPEANIIFGAAFDPSLDGKIRVSVVATGMDGSAMQAMEPRTIRSTGAAPRRLGDAGLPKAAEPAVETESVATVAAFEEAQLFELPVAAEAPSQEPAWMFDAPAEPAPMPITSIQPDLIELDLYDEPARAVPVAARIEDEEPLFPDMNHDDRRPQKGGWLSLFGGRPRYEAVAAPAPRESVRDVRAAAAPAVQSRPTSAAQLAEAPRGDEGEDLNIPSFLRRLAN